MKQCDLFLSPEAVNERHEKYLSWRKANDDVFQLIKKICLRLLKRERRFSIYSVIHHVRFNEYFEDKRDDPYRLSNNHGPYIDRELIEQYPKLADYIAIKRVQGQEEEE